MFQIREKNPMPMYEDPILEKLDELMSLIRVLDTKINFLQQDIEDLKQTEIQMMIKCLEQLSQQQLQEIEKESSKNWVVERL